MNLKNYTSNTPAHQTIAYIEAYLAECGVNGVTKQYENKTPIALFFHIEIADQKYTIRLPAKVSEVQEWLWRQYCSSVRHPRKQKTDFEEQAARTAWAIQRDWVQVQMSLIKLKQVEFLEVFMGFLWDGKQSYYSALRASGYKALPETTKSL
jgi:hypothetical protein